MENFTAQFAKGILLCLFLLISRQAAADTYRFIPPDSDIPVRIRIDSLFEMNRGKATGIDGELCIDLPTRTVSCGQIIIPSGSIIMSNRIKTAMLHSKKWLNKKSYPNIIFEFRNVDKMVKTSESSMVFFIKGDLTIKDVTKTQIIPVEITDTGRTRGSDFSANRGDYSLHSEFSISRKAFNIKPNLPVSIVDDTIRLDINLCCIKTDGLMAD